MTAVEDTGTRLNACLDDSSCKALGWKSNLTAQAWTDHGCGIDMGKLTGNRALISRAIK